MLQTPATDAALPTDSRRESVSMSEWLSPECTKAAASSDAVASQRRHGCDDSSLTPNVIAGDCRYTLRELASESFQCCVTSPPYWKQRDYGHVGQMGLEETPDAFVSGMVDVFREVRRVLCPSGTLWLNMGDTYNNRTRLRKTSHQPSLNGFSDPSWASSSASGKVRMTCFADCLKEKDLIGVPWMLALALRRDGWYLRQEIIWQKTFGKPEPTKDRMPTRHEHLFLFAKSKRYLFKRSALPDYAKSSVWKIAPTGKSEHGASFPRELVAPCLLAGTDRGDAVLDPFAGSGTTGDVAQSLGRPSTLIELTPAIAGLATSEARDVRGSRNTTAQGDN